MMAEEEIIEQTRLLIERLERISVDSAWSRRSSGHRGALLKWIQRLEPPAGQNHVDLSEKELDVLESLIITGFQFLEKAARDRFH